MSLKNWIGKAIIGVLAFQLASSPSSVASVNVTVNGTSYTIPQKNEKGWGDNVTSWIQAISSYALQPTGGTFTLSSDVNFGASFGLIAPYYKSNSSNIASTGIFRLANTDALVFRNSTNTADLALKPNATTDGILQYNSVDIPTISSTHTLTNKSLSDTTTKVVNATDATKAIKFDSSGNTTGTALTIAGSTTTNRTFTIPDVTDTAVGVSATQTLTNKVLSGNTATSLINGSGTTNFNSSGTITLPNATDTLVGKATTDTLTNKSIDATTNTLTNIGNSSVASNAAIAISKLASGSSGQVVKMVGTTPTWATFSGGINYVSSNPDAESDTSGWSTYNDGVSATPVDCTGGVVSGLTFSRSTTSPIRGTGSFLLTQANATSIQGEGVAYAFTIDNADQAKSIQASFDFNADSNFTASSGQTGSDSDLEVFVYDVTNASLVPVSPKVITANGSNNYTFKGTFQTASNSTSYRLCVHAATTHAPATGYNFKFDNVNVGPVISTFVSPITDWSVYTPTISNLGSGSTTNNQAFYRRVGDSIELKGAFVKDATAGTGSNTVTVSLPAGLSIDTNKLNTTNNSSTFAGKYELTSGGAFASLGEVVRDATSGNTVIAFAANGGGSLVQGSSVGASQTFAYSVLVPIAGWASTVQMSNDANTRVIGANYIGQPTGTLNSTFNTITFPTLVSDKSSSYSGGVYTVPVSGLWDIQAQVDVNGTWSAGQYATCSIFINGVQKYDGSIAAGNASTTDYLANVNVKSVPLVAGDLVTIRVKTTATSPSFINSSTSNYFSISLQNGPSAIAASESLNARANTSTTTGTNFTAIFSSKSYDTHSAYSTSTGAFTAPISGKYAVKAAVTVNAVTLTTAQFIQLNLYKNGSSYSQLGFTFGNGASAKYVAVGSDSVSLNAGDTLNINVQSSVSVTLDGGANTNYFAIERVGN